MTSETKVKSFIYKKKRVYFKKKGLKFERKEETVEKKFGEKNISNLSLINYFHGHQEAPQHGQIERGVCLSTAFSVLSCSSLLATLVKILISSTLKRPHDERVQVQPHIVVMTMMMMSGDGGAMDDEI